MYSWPLKILQTEGKLHITITVNHCSVHHSSMDSSSQLEDSFVDGKKRTEIHVTPLAKKKRVGRTRKRKRDTEMEKVVSGQTCQAAIGGLILFHCMYERLVVIY